MKINEKISDQEKLVKKSLEVNDPYTNCPIYEAEGFILRMVEEKDAEELLECYSDPDSGKLFNSDNCTSNFIYNSLDEMKSCIEFWLQQYKDKYYVRFSIINKLSHKAVGTIEIFKRKEGLNNIDDVGILRLDLASKYEKEKFIKDLLDCAKANFYEDFKVKNIITKALPAAAERIGALRNTGFTELEASAFPFHHYFIITK